MNKINIVISIFLVIITALLCNYFTYESVNSEWYEKIKPDLNPPKIIFHIAWSIIYLLLMYTIYLVLELKNSNNKNILILFILLNLILNILWCYVFFKLNDTVNSRIIILLILLSILVISVIGYYENKLIPISLVLYFLWVSFATLLNFKTKRVSITHSYHI
jgi:tryptophan-rich sensory protein